MKFSIIIPLFNSEKYLTECVNSVLNQSFDNFEIILVDDGSTDASVNICDDYSRKYNNIKVFHKVNGGQSSARNLGLRYATGDYIVFLDSDDKIIDENFLNKVFSIIEKEPRDIIAFKYVDYFEDSNTVKRLDINFSECRSDNYNETIKNLICKDAFYCSAWSKVINKELIVNNDIMFDEKSKCEDMDWYFNVVCQAQSIALLDEEIVEYRHRDGSVTATIREKNFSDYLFFIETWYKLLFESENDLHHILMHALAKLYANLLVAYVKFKGPNKKKIYLSIKKYRHILKYYFNPKVKKIYRIMRIFGFRLTLFALVLYLKVR